MDEITINSNKFQFAQNLIASALNLLPTEVETQYADPKFNDVKQKIKKMIENCDSNEFVTVQQAIQIIEPFVLQTEDNIITLRATDVSKMLNEVMILVFNYALAKLASEEKIDIVWNEENNAAEFWIK